jgi:DNA-binding NarL/FixJ family response regulator
MMPNITKVIIADDHALFADGLAQIIEQLPDFVVIAKVKNGKELLQKINSHIPELILLDINMPLINGMTAAEKIVEGFPQIKIIFISMHSSKQIILQAKKIGVHAFVQKNLTAPDLISVLNKVTSGEKVFMQAESTIDGVDDKWISSNTITRRESEIIQLIKGGYASKQIAATLNLSIYTVETHRKNIHRKLNVQSTAELLAVLFHDD